MTRPETWGAALEQGGYQDDPQRSGHVAQLAGGGTRNGLSQVKAVGILGLTEIRTGVQFLEHHQLSPPAGGLLDRPRPVQPAGRLRRRER